MTEFVTSDLHFRDKAMVMPVGFIQRPFATTCEMDELLIERWNSAVRPGDHVFVLGDVFGSKTNHQKQLQIFKRLRGVKSLVLGNHDTRITKSLPWGGVWDVLQIERGGVSFTMRHHPPRMWARGMFYLHGHTHLKTTSMPAYDVGVDGHDFTPIPMEELVAKAQAYRRGFDRLVALQKDRR